jgi:hypothetical protein
MLIDERSVAAYDLSINPLTGTFTKSLSPRYSARSARRRMLQPSSDIDQMNSDRASIGQPSRMFSISSNTAPPEDGGGIK